MNRADSSEKDNAIAQAVAGSCALWNALVSSLVAEGAIDQERLLLHVSIAHRKIPAECDGPIARRITHGAAKAIIADLAELGEVPEWAQQIIEELEPMALADLPLLVERA